MRFILCHRRLLFCGLILCFRGVGRCLVLFLCSFLMRLVFMLSFCVGFLFFLFFTTFRVFTLYSSMGALPFVTSRDFFLISSRYAVNLVFGDFLQSSRVFFL